MTANMRSNVDQKHPNEDPLLFRPLMLRGVKLRNRIVASPMCQYNSVEGAPTDWHFAHLGRLAIGGAGLVFYEETAVEARGRKTHACAGIWSNEHIPAYRRLADLIWSIGATPGIQLGHSGGKASSHGALRDWALLTEQDARDGLAPWQPVAPSAVTIGNGRPIPHGLDQAEIRGIVAAWSEAAQRCAQAGFEVLEIHGAHGCLKFMGRLRSVAVF
jgi:2,4-dienoyl-CoA reductase-like NADH-dependent reductase (Old Yellow Enzyme family)